MATTRRQLLKAALTAGGTAFMQLGAPVGAQTLNVFDYKRNWGRWGQDDEKGAVNLITPAKRAAAARLVRSGRIVPLSREFSPSQHYLRTNLDRGSFVDYYGFEYHGVTITHVDALSHMWDRNGMWNGRDPAKELDSFGARYGAITAFGDGIVTRGVLLDIPRLRGTPFVTTDRPVTGAELEAAAQAQGVTIEPGDALLLHCGREAFVRAGNTYGSATDARPGLHNSCGRFLRDKDVALLAWDMHDALPDPDGHRWPAHGVLYTYGVVLVDNSLLEPLAQVCAEERRYEFMFVALPLRIARGTGSPANPIALF